MALLEVGDAGETNALAEQLVEIHFFVTFPSSSRYDGRGESAVTGLIGCL